jgi:hypothetical protein
LLADVAAERVTEDGARSSGDLGGADPREDLSDRLSHQLNSQH